MVMKAAQRIARDVEDWIVTDRILPGTRLGSEPELIAQYEISRSIFREAVRILESEGIAAMRRGPGGGLYALAPESVTVTHAAALWLRFNQANVADLYDVRETLEARVAALAAERADMTAVTELRKIVDEQRQAAAEENFDSYTALTEQFHETVAQISGNMVASLFVQMLMELNSYMGAAPEYQKHQLVETDDAHAAISEAIITGDSALASRRMINHLRASRAFAENLIQTDRQRKPTSIRNK